MDFYEALRHILQGKKVTKAEWGNENVYGQLKNNELWLHKDEVNADNGYFLWTVQKGDIEGTDYYLLD